MKTQTANEMASASSQERILDAAESEFASAGFAGAGMKAISQAAGVAQALLHYHFGTKEKLFEEVIARRAAKISAAREACLARVDLAAPDALEGIFDAIFRPTFEEEGGGRAYGIIFSGKVAGDRDAHYLIDKYYDATARKFIAAIQAAEPRATAEVASWSYLLAIGALIVSIDQVGRLERLAGLPNRMPGTGIDHLVRPLVLNSVGGLLRMIDEDRGAVETQ